MELRYFAHSWLSDWNHGNAHFLRGLMSALVRRGHQVRVYEPMPAAEGGWSLSQLWREPGGAAAVAAVRTAYPELDLRLFGQRSPATPPTAAALTWVRDWEEELRGSDVVMAHEWNSPELFEWLLNERRRYGFRLLLHDTHHRAVSQPEMLDRLPLPRLDGVIAFGESLRRCYHRHGRCRRTFTLHEAADTARFRPTDGAGGQHDVVWIGNWGDEERSQLLEQYLLTPVRQSGARARIYGVRYPPAAREQLQRAGIGYGGYLPNLRAPAAYAQAAMTLHIPRGPYRRTLPGIPTIRVFEALACAMPLLSAPWDDCEGLFAVGEDFWMAHSPQEMTALLVQLLSHPEQRKALGQHGAASVRARHTCAHRAGELEAICQSLN
jgi:spore maturation protein CgeB